MSRRTRRRHGDAQITIALLFVRNVDGLRWKNIARQSQQANHYLSSNG
jgi:hypothetical protein